MMKKKLLVFAIVFFSSVALKAQLAYKDSLRLNPLCDSVVNFAKTFLGTNYCYGAASPKKGFDCSGFTWFVFNHYGIAIPRSAKDYKTFGKEVPIGQARKGDIIVFRGTHVGDKSAGHVGIIISNPGEKLQFIHSSSSKNHSGVTITDYYSSAYTKRFIKIIRVIN